MTAVGHARTARIIGDVRVIAFDLRQILHSPAAVLTSVLR